MTEKTAPRARRTLSGKYIPADTPKIGWGDIVGPPDQPVKPVVKPPATVDVVIRKRREEFAHLSRREARATGAEISFDRLHTDVPVWEVSGRARADRRFGNRRRATEQRKGNRAYARRQAAIEQDNAQVEHLLALAGREPSDMQRRAVSALEARHAARQAAAS